MTPHWLLVALLLAGLLVFMFLAFRELSRNGKLKEQLVEVKENLEDMTDKWARAMKERDKFRNLYLDECKTGTKKNQGRKPTGPRK